MKPRKSSPNSGLGAKKTIVFHYNLASASNSLETAIFRYWFSNSNFFGNQKQATLVSWGIKVARRWHEPSTGQGH
jgi:hypothetical protein